VIKFITNSILSLLFVISTGGVNIYHHYCGTRLVSSTIDFKPDNCCTGCKDCKTKLINVRVKTNYVSNHGFVDFKPKQIASPEHVFIPVDLFTASLLYNHYSDKEMWLKHPCLNPMHAGDQEAFLQIFRV
jgi:hypothetical protein